MKEVAGSLRAAYEFASQDFEVEKGIERERRGLALDFSIQVRSLLLQAGSPDESDPNRFSTPEIIFPTGRGDVVLQVLGVKDPATGFYKRVSLETRYSKKQPLQFVPPGDPEKTVSVEVEYDERGELDMNPYKLPKRKQLRKANYILGVLQNRTLQHPSFQAKADSSI